MKRSSRGDVEKEITNLRGALKGDIVVHGNAQLVQFLLAESKTVGDGVAIQIYTPARKEK